MHSILKRVCCACLLILGAAVPAYALAQQTPSSDMVPLSLLAAREMDKGSVMIYSAQIGGVDNVRRCLQLNSLTALDPVIAFADCDFNKPGQKWLLDSSHQVRSQANPARCLKWPVQDYAAVFDVNGMLTTTDCMATPDATQIFLFQGGGRIANLGSKSCLAYVAGNTQLAVRDPCDGAGVPETSLQFRLEPHPEVLYQFTDFVGNTARVAIESDGGVFKMVNFTGNSLEQYWYLTPAADGTDRVLVQNLKTGHCLRAFDSDFVSVKPCAISLGALEDQTFRKVGTQIQIFSNHCLTGQGPNTLTMSWSESQMDLGACTVYPPLVVSDLPTPMNFALVNRDSNFNVSCLAPDKDSNSLNLVKLTCGTKAERLSAAMDYLPDRTLRPRATGRCLEVANASVKQSNCALSSFKPQNWGPVDITPYGSVAPGGLLRFSFSDRGSTPAFTRFGWRSYDETPGLTVPDSRYVLRNYQSAGAFAVSRSSLYGANYPNVGDMAVPDDINWYTAALNDLLVNPCYSTATGPSVLTYTDTCRAENAFSTTVWDGKFRYGAYSTLASTLMLRAYYPSLIAELNSSYIASVDYTKLMSYLKEHYASFRNLDFLRLAPSAHDGNVFEPWRSIIPITRPEVNRAFMKNMAAHAELKPVDNLIPNGQLVSTNMQYNAHRGAYDIGLGVPDNSLAAIVAAYLAGIRSVEFDVLQTTDSQSIVVHDLMTNRLNANYGSPAINVEKSTFADVGHTPTLILNPVGSAPGGAPTGIGMMMNTENVLDFIHKYMPEMVAYIDARNDSPAAVLEILHRHPEYVPNVVLKIYPFTLKSGGIGLVAAYAKVRNARLPGTFSISDYTNKYDPGIAAAAVELAKIRANVLLALGSAGEQAETELPEVGLQYDDFTQSTYISRCGLVPFCTFPGSEFGLTPYTEGKPFTADDYTAIDNRTYKMFKWAASFAGITNTVVLQINLLPSMQRMLSASQVDAAMDKGAMIQAAANDNFVALYRAVTTGTNETSCLSSTLQIRVDDRSADQSTYLGCKWAHTVFGFSDRYEDYSLAQRKTDGSVDSSTVRSFLYKMDGTVYESNGFGAKKMRSSAAVAQMIADLKAKAVPVQYVTTDMPEDLRTAAMGMLGPAGGYGLPADVDYRPGSVLKQSVTPADIPGFAPPAWSLSLPPARPSTGGNPCTGQLCP